MGTRTPNLLITNQLLYQLSYTGPRCGTASVYRRLQPHSSPGDFTALGGSRRPREERAGSPSAESLCA